MLKIGLTAAVTAACCFAVAATTGFGASAPAVLNMKPNEVISLKSDNFHCQELKATEVACGANTLPNSMQVYFTTHQLVVLKFDKTGKKASVVYSAKR
jgi:hypothetical protein